MRKLTDQENSFWKGDYLSADIKISTNKAEFNIDYIHQHLAGSYWSPNIPKYMIEKMIQNSICFFMTKHSKPIGFARVITDSATFAYLADVFVDPAEQGQGYGIKLIEFIMNYPEVQGLRRWMLATKDAHGLYEKVGFTALSQPERIMEIVTKPRYKQG